MGIEQLNGIRILYNDDYLVVANKPAGIPTTPDRNYATSLQSVLAQHFHSLGEYSPAHRLDKDTSGIIVGGLRDKIRGELGKQFQNGSVDKLYLAIVEGCLEVGSSNLVNHPLLYRRRRNITVVDYKKGKKSLTEYVVLDNLNVSDSETELSLLLVKLNTGRTHQIRAHLAHIGYPLLGDPKYNSGKSGNGLHLHAASLSFVHPVTEEQMKFVSFPEWISEDKIPKVQAVILAYLENGLQISKS